MINNNYQIVLNAVEETDYPSDKLHNLCSICGSNKHDNKNCDYIKITNIVPDKEIPSKARLSLPDCLEIIKQSDGSFNIRTKIALEKGTEFGPFVANKMFSLSPEIEFSLKVFIDNSEDFNEYYLDTRDEHNCNWMMFISAAADFEEQNLVCYQKNEDIYYATKKNIREMEVLKVWYAPFYGKKMGKALLEPPVLEENFPVMDDLNNLIETQQKIKKRDLWTCKYCGKVENAIVKFAHHILLHYSNYKSKRCEFCNKLCNSRENLEKHLKIVHNTFPATIPIKENIISLNTNCPKANKPIEVENNEIGGPLIAGKTGNLISEALDNNFLTSTNFNFDNEVDEPLNMDLLDENVDFFNLDMNFNPDKEEDFVCDICQRSFKKVRNLVQHLQGHTGRFFCDSCNRVFGRLESLRHHSCRKIFSIKCDQCDKVFTQRKNLTAHVKSIHEKQFKCEKCQRSYCSKAELELHNCRNVPLHNKRQFRCDLCGKMFLRQKYLKSHLLRHEKSKSSLKVCENKKFICHICSKVYMSQKNYQFHLNSHNNSSTFNCEICDKKFARSDSLKSHLSIHKNLFNVHNCPTCDKAFKTPKSLNNHVKVSHSKAMFPCSDCPASFKMKTSLKRHYKIKHELDKKKQEPEGKFKCSQCSKTMKLKSSLTRHMKTAHQTFYETICDDKVEKQADVNVQIENNDFGQAQSNFKAHESNNIVINIDDVLDTNAIDNLLNNNSGNLMNNAKDVFLSMPDLTESELDAEMHFPLIHNDERLDFNDKKDEVVIYVVDKK